MVAQVGLPPGALVSPKMSIVRVMAYSIAIAIMFVTNLWLCVWIAVDTLDGCPLLQPLLSTVHGFLGLSGVAGGVTVAVLWYLGPPSHDRTNMSERKTTVMVDFLQPEDFGQGELAKTFSTLGVTVGLCHCPGKEGTELYNRTCTDWATSKKKVEPDDFH